MWKQAAAPEHLEKAANFRNTAHHSKISTSIQRKRIRTSTCNPTPEVRQPDVCRAAARAGGEGAGGQDRPAAREGRPRIPPGEVKKRSSERRRSSRCTLQNAHTFDETFLFPFPSPYCIVVLLRTGTALSRRRGAHLRRDRALHG